jgi:hypothetical protein
VTSQEVQGFESLRLRRSPATKDPPVAGEDGDRRRGRLWGWSAGVVPPPPHPPPGRRTERREGRAARPGPLDGRRLSGSRLRPGVPAALPGHRLRLLPSGPDRVHGSGSRRTRPSTLLTGGWPGPPVAADGYSARRIEGFRYRGPRTPRLARPRERIRLIVWESHRLCDRQIHKRRRFCVAATN